MRKINSKSDCIFSANDPFACCEVCEMILFRCKFLNRMTVFIAQLYYSIVLTSARHTVAKFVFVLFCLCLSIFILIDVFLFSYVCVVLIEFSKLSLRRSCVIIWANWSMETNVLLLCGEEYKKRENT